MFLEKPFFGIGIGAFQREYNLYQSLYFKSGGYSLNEFLLADNTFFAFNDYWQFIVETGLLGATILFLAVFILLRIIQRRIKNNDQDPLLLFFICTVIIFFTAALFTHIFENMFFRSITISSLIVIGFYDKIKKLKTFKRAGLMGALIITVGSINYTSYLMNIHKYAEFEQAKLLANIGYLKEAKEIMIKLYPSLSNDVTYLREYNDILIGNGFLNQKVNLLKKVLTKYSDYQTFLKLGTVYQELGMYNNAEDMFIMAVNMVPNRFESKQMLFNFYFEQRRYKDATYWQNIILNMPVKIPSERVNLIKQAIKSKQIN